MIFSPPKDSSWRGLRLDDIQHVTMIPLMRKILFDLFDLGILRMAFNSLNVMKAKVREAQSKGRDRAGGCEFNPPLLWDASQVVVQKRTKCWPIGIGGLHFYL